MSSIRRKIAQKRQDSGIYRSYVEEDEYGHESYGYETDPSGILERILWSPISSEVEVAEYGERVNEMLQGCVFDDSISLKEKDRVKVGDNMYNVESIKPYPSYRLVIIERVK
jgi:hypothetical protein